MTAIAAVPETEVTEREETAEETLGRSPDESARQTIVLHLHVGMPNFRRRMQAADVVDEADVDPNMLHVAKDLLDREAISELLGARDQLKRKLKGRALPCRMLPGGMYLMPLGLVEEVDGWVVEFRARFDVLVDRLCVAYEGYKQAAEVRLKDHYDESEYPTLGRLRRSFEVQARWLTFNVPAALKTFKRAIYEREQAKARLEWAEASEDIRLALREGLAGLVTNFVEKLGMDEKGKKRTFRDETMAKMRDFLATFEARNMVNDGELAALAEQARQALAGVEPDQLRKQDVARERVREGFERIKGQLDALLVATPRRRIATGDEKV
jgi:hypothetical protein